MYGDRFDDREEDAAPGGLDWRPGKQARHKSLKAFQRELEEKGISLSTAKIRKILITGNCWSTERSREVGYLYETYTIPAEEGGPGMKPDEARIRIAEELEITPAMVAMLLPYDRIIYNIPDKTKNAERCDRWRDNTRAETQIRSPEDLEELSRLLIRGFSFGNETIAEARKTVHAGIYTYTFDATTLLPYVHGLNRAEENRLDDLLHGFYQKMHDDNREGYKELVERRTLLYFLLSSNNSYRDYRIEKRTRPDFVLQGDKTVGVELTKLTTKHDEILFTIANQTVGKGMTAEEVKEHARKYHKHSADQYDYCDEKGFLTIESKIQDLDHQRKHYAELLSTKYRKYEHEVPNFDDFIILGDASTGPGLVITESYETNQVIDYLKEICPEIHNITIVIIWNKPNKSTKLYTWFHM